MPALATIPSAIQSNPGAFNLDPLRLDEFRSAVGPINYDVTGAVIAPGVTLYEQGADQLVTSTNNSHVLAASHDELILLNTAWRGVGNVAGNNIVGNEANNRIEGLNGDDVLIGGGGIDNLFGGNQNDLILGGTGNDYVHGGAGNDSLLGDEGNDFILGAAGNDHLEGGLNNDTLDGGGGNDILLGGAGADTVKGQAGNDVIYGGSENDHLDGGVGNDTMYGEQGNDLMVGGSGNDTLFGGAGTDNISADAGNDVVDSGTGNDLVIVGAKGAGFDTFVWNDGDGNDTVRGLDTKDKLDFRGGSNDADPNVDVIFTQVGKDTHVTMEDGSVIVLQGVKVAQLRDTNNDDIWDID